MALTSEELMTNVNNILESEGQSLEAHDKTPMEQLRELLLPALAHAKDTMSSLYGYEPPKRHGILGKVKYQILIRFRNITFNIVEKQSMRQQKFNELVFRSIEQLIEENKELQSQREMKNSLSKETTS